VRVFFSAGEASGDAYAAALLRKVAERVPGLEFQGIGGRRLREAAAEVVSDSSNWGAIGVVQVLKRLPGILGGYYRAKQSLAAGHPGLFVPIDFGYANLRLARHAKNHGWKVLYFVPPGSWRKDRQGKDLPALTDAIVSPFPWAAEMLREMGANAHFFGHPIKQMIREANEKWEPGPRVGIALLPGSRLQEIERHMGLLAGALKDRREAASFGVAPSIDPDRLRRTWHKLAPDRREDAFSEDVYRVLCGAKAGAICSGTASLEAALCRCPCVVFYRLSKATEMEARIVRPKFEFISLPNILMGREIVPELAHFDATSEHIGRHLDSLLDDEELRRRQLADFDELDDLLGPSVALDKTADLVAEMTRQ
jgi:lipid-A-disaccharide synthase